MQKDQFGDAGKMQNKYMKSRKAKNGTEILPKDKIKCISWEKDICEWLMELLIQLKEPLN